MSSLATSRANISILDVLFVFISICWVWGLCYMNAICIFFFYIYWCSKRLPYHIMFLSYNSSTAGVTNGAETFYPQIIQGFIPFMFVNHLFSVEWFYQVRVITVFTVFRCWLILSVYKLMSFDFPFGRLFGVR
jgi:hypothetical protein